MPHQEETLSQLLTVATTVLSQALGLVQSTVKTEHELTWSSKHIPGSTIGKHLRHALDHFTLLLDALDADDNSSERLSLSYDVRKRNTPVETSREAAREAYERMIARLEALNSNTQHARPGRVTLAQPVALAADTPHTVNVASSFGRELWFCSLHAVHHWSMIRVICGELNLSTDEDFGFAPSTLKYHKGEGKSKI
ncbi:hypothetical protein EXIGLDRAFT_829624 [Exidia glandulosa HHB12029]|uniref:DinB-like domain-containing protein n=1 Tax=Exidia glandulosa HHB12029 TaxID=1314781 RepID=A0A165PER0_EXIGL|nr:hypothetical protein EXIGLDRAFT_829624 [Exidia glandulosa HHB12029]